MTDTPATRHRAPIEYVDLRWLLNTVRAIAAALIVVAASAYALLIDVPRSWLIAAAAVIVVVDALRRRHHGTSALAPLLIDVTIIGVALVVRGSAPLVQIAALLYIVITAMLLLPLPQAGGAIGYAALWVLVVSITSQFAPALTTDGSRAVRDAFDAFAASTFLAGITILLYGATRSLLAGQDRQRRALEVERRAVEVKNEFVSMVSHELRTPLTGIAGFTETLREYWRDLPQAEVDEFLTIMRAETAHLANLVEDILVIPRLEAGQLRLQPQPIALAAEVREIASLVFEDDGCEVDLPTDVVVVADRQRVRQILRNLIENAQKYGGDQVLVEASERTPGLLTVIISDNGPGVSDEDQARIFEHFEQLSKGDARIETGVGLGLPIARKLARAMGGDLWYESRFPVGSRFCFTIGLAPEIAAPTKIPSPQSQVAPALG